MDLDLSQIRKKFAWLKKFGEKHPTWSRVCLVLGTLTTAWFIRDKIISRQRRLSKLPPGMNGVPVLGSWLTAILFHKTYHSEIIPKYGAITTLRVGSRNLEFIINDCDLLRGLFDKAFDRAPAYGSIFKECDAICDITGANEDEYWSFRRKTLMTYLTRILSKETLNQHMNNIFKSNISKEIDKLIDNNNNNNKYGIWYPSQDIQNITFNVIYFALFGQVLDVKDEKYLEYDNYAHNWVKHFGIGFLTGKLLPKWVSNLIFGKDGALKKFRQTHFNFQKLLLNDLNDLKIKINNNEEIFETITQEILKQNEMISNNNNNNSNNNDSINKNSNNFIYDEKYLLADILVLFIAGTQTTGLAMHVGSLLAAKYPQIQETVYNELKDKFLSGGDGDDGDGLEFDLSRVLECVNLRAFVSESLRLGSGLPTTPPHINLEKDIRCLKLKENSTINNKNLIVQFADKKEFWGDIENEIEMKKNNNMIEYDYILPKKCLIRANLKYMGVNNTKIWGENGALKMNLNHWLKKTKNGTLRYVVNKHSLPFSTGRRDCLGQNLATKEIVCFFANLFLKYKLEPIDGNPDSIDIQFTFDGQRLKKEIPIKISKRTTSNH